MNTDLDTLFLSTVFRYQNDPERFRPTEREKSFWGQLPDCGLRLSIGEETWIVLKGEADGEFVIGEFRLTDQGGCLHDYDKTNLYKVISYIESDTIKTPAEGDDPGDPTSSENDFWFRAYPSRNELMVCLGFSNRVFMQYLCRPNLYLSYDSEFSGGTLVIWDPGMSIREIPFENFICKEDAIRYIREFHSSGFISIDERWSLR